MQGHGTADGSVVTYRHPQILQAWWENAVWHPWHCPETVTSLTLLIPTDSSASPRAPANATPPAQGGEKVPVRGMQLFIFLNNPFGRLGSKQQEKLWCLPAPAHSRTVGFVEPQKAKRQLLEVYPSNIFFFFFFAIRIKIFNERQSEKVV